MASSTISTAPTLWTSSTTRSRPSRWEMTGEDGLIVGDDNVTGGITVPLEQAGFGGHAGVGGGAGVLVSRVVSSGA